MSKGSEERGLVGKTVLITRAEDDSLEWAERVQERGANALVYPCLVVRPVDEPGLVTSLQRSLEQAHWVVATSRRGVERAHALLGAPPPASVMRAAVGPRTAARVRELWERVDLTAESGTGSGLAEDLVASLSDGDTQARVVVVTARGGRRDIETTLRTHGAHVDRFELYETVPAARSSSPRDLARDDVDVVLLASPSAVTGLVNRAVVPEDAQIITIGPTTSDAARRAGLRVDAEARTRTLDGLLEEVR